MNQSTDRKLKLRVAMKLMVIVAVFFISYVFIQYSFKDNDSAQSIRVDLSDLPPGEYKIVRRQGRSIVVLHRTQAMLAALEAEATSDPYLVVYQQSPDFSCPLDVILPDATEQGGFKAVCSGTLYDLSGKLLPDQNARFDLEEVDHSIEGTILTIGPG